MDPLPDHLVKPHLRPIQPVPVEREGKKLVALRDPTRLCDQTIVVPIQAMPIIQHFHGDRTIDELASEFNSNPGQIAQLVKGLDRMGLLWGPTFERMESERWDSLRASGVFPPRVTTSLGEDEASCRATIESYFEQTEDPELDEPAVAVVAPHLDYARGWPNYAAAYYALRDTPAPDRVVILGTNHYGLGDGVVVTEIGVETPMGSCPVDGVVFERLRDALGRPLVVDQLDHLPEHSIELQIPWIQYCYGDVPVIAALMPDPLQDPIDNDGGRITGPQFVDALRDVLADVGGTSMFIASSDLSHVGPQFGEPRPVDEQRRIDVERHDRDMMSKFIAGDPEEFLGAMRWTKNPTRWCSVGNMAALLTLTRPNAVELIDYRQAYDEKGMVMVTSAAMVLV